VSRDLQKALKKTGLCCHGATAVKESCKECPALLAVSGSKSLGNVEQVIDGTYVKTNIKPVKFNGGKPIYVIPKRLKEGTPLYLYYSQTNVMWFIGRKYDSNLFEDFISYAGAEAQCPRDAGAWQFQRDGKMIIHGISTRAAPKPSDAPSDTDRIVWNVETHEWEREEAGQAGQSSFDDDEDASKEKRDEDREAAKEADNKKKRLAAEAAAKRALPIAENKHAEKEEEPKVAGHAEKKRIAGEDAEAKRLEASLVTLSQRRRLSLRAETAEDGEMKRIAEEAADAVRWMDEVIRTAEAAEKQSPKDKVSADTPTRAAV